MARIGEIRVNSTEYGDEIVIEQFAHWGSSGLQDWAVPAWEERGDADLAGPFATRAEAESALTQYEALWS